MNKKLVRVLVGSLLALAALGMVGCEWLLEEVLFGASGRIVDARGGEETDLRDFQVRLAAVSGSRSYGPRNSTSTGTFSFSDVESGTYILTAEKPGWFVPPVEVNVGGLAQGFPDVPAFQLKVEDLWGLSFIAVWRNSEDGVASNDIDVDLHVTFPTSREVNDVDFTTPYAQTISGTVNRSYVAWNQRYYPDETNPTVRLDNDTTMLATGGRPATQYGPSNPQLPETATLLTVPFLHTFSGTGIAMPASGSDPTGIRNAFLEEATELGLVDSIKWNWVGTSVAYLNAFNAQNTGTNLSSRFIDNNGDTQLGADAVLYVIMTTLDYSTLGDDAGKGSDEVTVDNLRYSFLGAYRVAEYTYAATASMVRVNMFVDNDGYAWYQIVPDQRVIPAGSTGILSMDQDASVFGVRGRRVAN